VAKLSKRMKAIAEKVDKEKNYPIEEAVTKMFVGQPRYLTVPANLFELLCLLRATTLPRQKQRVRI